VPSPRRAFPRMSSRAIATIVATAACAAMLPATAANANVGSSTVPSGVDSNMVGRAQIYKLSSTATNSVDRLSTYLDGASTASKVELGLYSGSSAASKRLARCVVTTPNPNAWNRCTFSAVSVNKGSTYWLAILQPSGSTGTIQYRSTNTYGQTYGSSSSALTAVPYTWTNGPNWGAQTAALYADTTSGTTNPTPPTTTPAAPTASFSVTPASPTAGQAATFDASGSSCSATPCTYSWTDDTAGTTIGSGQKLSYTFAAAGTKTVRLTVKDAAAQTASTTRSVTVASASPTNPTPPPTTTPGTGCDLHATTSNFASVFASASGQSICLASGSYGTFSGAAKSATVTLRPETGATPSLAVNWGSSVSNVRIDGVKVTGAYIANAKNVAIVNSVFSGPTEVLANVGGLNMLFNNDTFDGLGHSTHEGRLSFSGGNASNSSLVGVTVSNSHFGNGGCSDGIQLTGDVNGVQVGPGNEFANIKEGSCTEHADPIQFYGARNTKITGSYFHNNSTGLMSGDGNGSPMTLTDNVFVTDGEYPDQVVIGGGSGDVLRHNVFANGARIRIGRVNVSASTNETVVDNVITGGFWFSESQSTSGFSLSNNLGSGLQGTNNVSGSPSYAGGSAPTTWAGFALASGSLGTSKASDGGNIGIRP
jgi:hypothetical protein